jgi:DNA-binding transcriptional ArsR family regulator
VSDSADFRNEVLERIFHEPNRLSIMSVLCGSRKGMSFTELKDACRLTDGNLNRHLKVLEEADSIRIEKAFVDSKPRTTIYLSDTGWKRFGEYLDALAGVVEKARQALPSRKPAPHGAFSVQPVKA